MLQSWLAECLWFSLWFPLSGTCHTATDPVPGGLCLIADPRRALLLFQLRHVFLSRHGGDLVTGILCSRTHIPFAAHSGMDVARIRRAHRIRGVICIDGGSGVVHSDLGVCGVCGWNPGLFLWRVPTPALVRATAYKTRTLVAMGFVTPSPSRDLRLLLVLPTLVRRAKSPAV